MTTYYTPPHVLDPAAGSSASPRWYLCEACQAWFYGMPEEHLHSTGLARLPRWYAPTVTHLDVTRTMAWCGSQDVMGGEE